jgi:hypothetical protein
VVYVVEGKDIRHADGNGANAHKRADEVESKIGKGRLARRPDPASINSAQNTIEITRH